MGDAGCATWATEFEAALGWGARGDALLGLDCVDGAGKCCAPSLAMCRREKVSHYFMNLPWEIESPVPRDFLTFFCFCQITPVYPIKQGRLPR